jgi:hypothetical protein
MNLCEVFEVRNSADADGFPCRRTASKECFDCGTELCDEHAETCGRCHEAQSGSSCAKSGITVNRNVTTLKFAQEQIP